MDLTLINASLQIIYGKLSFYRLVWRDIKSQLDDPNCTKDQVQLGMDQAYIFRHTLPIHGKVITALLYDALPVSVAFTRIIVLHNEKTYP